MKNSLILKILRQMDKNDKMRDWDKKDIIWHVENFLPLYKNCKIDNFTTYLQYDYEVQFNNRDEEARAIERIDNILNIANTTKIVKKNFKEDKEILKNSLEFALEQIDKESILYSEWKENISNILYKRDGRGLKKIINAIYKAHINDTITINEKIIFPYLVDLLIILFDGINNESEYQNEQACKILTNLDAHTKAEVQMAKQSTILKEFGEIKQKIERIIFYTFAKCIKGENDSYDEKIIYDNLVSLYLQLIFKSTVEKFKYKYITLNKVKNLGCCDNIYYGEYTRKLKSF